MARRDLSNKDYTEFATDELDYVLRRQTESKKSVVPTVTAAEAMQEKRLLQHQSSRDVTRVLFISQNTDLLNPTQQSLDGYLRVSEVFDEVHILILRQGIAPRQPVLRPEKNVFMYTVATRYWWQAPFAGIKMIKSQLVFADGFRPDLIVALDPFESAIVACRTAHTFKRPMQLHVLVNHWHKSFRDLTSANRWRKVIARYTIPKFFSIRARTERILKHLQEQTSIADLSRLPQVNPFEYVSRLEQELDLRIKYPQMVFNMLFIGRLNDATAALKAIDAARYMLRNKQISLIILGEGKERSVCEKRAKALGLEKQIIFEYRSQEYIQYIKAADLLIVTATDSESEEHVLQAASAHTPIVMVRTEQRDDIFTHLESAYLCHVEDFQGLSDGVHALATNYELRTHIAETAYRTLSESFHHDLETYRQQYRMSVEGALFAEEIAAELAQKNTDDTPPTEEDQSQ